LFLLTLLLAGTDKVSQVSQLESGAGSEAGSGSTDEVESNGCRRCPGIAVTGICSPSRPQVRRHSSPAGWRWGTKLSLM